jgi:HAE1 family hydrophobic/amphiphilic exporter-1
MHAFFLPFGIYPNNAIVGGSADIAMGSSLYKKINKKPGIVIANLGDASMGCGPVYEAMNFAAMEVREKIDLIKEALPREANEPIVLKYNPMQMEAMILSVSYKDQKSDPWKLAELRQFCKKNLKDELERMDGVAKVEIRGGEKKEVLVEIDKGRLLANQVSINEVINSLRDANVTYPAGTIKEEQYEYLVKTVGEFRGIEDIAALSFSKEDSSGNKRSVRRVRGDTGGGNKKLVYIRDIADVKESLKDKTGYSRYNRTENISLGVYPQSGANLIRMSKAVQKRVKELQNRFPPGVEVKVIYDQSDFIKASLNNIYSSAVQGGCLSFFILYLFMKSFMGSIIINIAIPVTMLFTLSLMYFGKISINTMSLGGLTIGIGMVVDNSNVVLENILTRFHENPSADRKETIYNATKELMGPIISSTLTGVAIFLPFIFVSGMAGQLFKQLALTITFSMLSSIFVALFLVPRMVLNMDMSKMSTIVGKESIAKYFTPRLKKVLDWPFQRLLKYVTVYALIGLLIFLLIPKESMPKVDERRFVLNVSLHPETPLDITNQVTERIERYLSKMKEFSDMSVTVGSTGDDSGVGAVESLGPYQTRIIAHLKKHGRSTDKVVQQLADEMKKWNIKGMESQFITQQGMFGTTAGSGGLTVEIKGKDLKQLRERAMQIKNKMSSEKAFYGIKMNPSDMVPELKVQVDREKASVFGLSTQDISAMSLAAIKGHVATKLKLKDDEFDIRVRMRPEDRDSLEKIGEMTAYSQWGMTIQLKQISDLQFVKSMPAIRRINGQRTYLVTSEIKGSLNSGVSKIHKILNKLPPMEDVTAEITGEMLAMKESMKSSVFALVLGVVVIFMILASQFESLGQPAIVMTAVPLALIGALYTLFFTGKSVNSISMLGVIMLTGNAVSISIMLVDRYNFYLANAGPGTDIKHIILETTSEHVRPILMTTLTTIIDLLPLALGLGEGSEATAPMAITVVGGLSFALVMCLFFVPRVYLATKRYELAKVNAAGADQGTAVVLPQEVSEPTNSADA